MIPIACVGGPNANSVFSWPSPLPSFKLTYIGCFTDASTRAMRWLNGGTEGGYMTVEICAHLAYVRGYTYFGLEGGEFVVTFYCFISKFSFSVLNGLAQSCFTPVCFASNSLAEATVYGPSSGCNFACLGDSSQICGGCFPFRCVKI